MSSATLQRKLQTAVARHQSGDVDSALLLYAEILRDDPQQADAWHLTGLASYQQGDDVQAESLVRYALELSPGNLKFQANLASILVRQEQYEEAERICREVLKKSPKDAGALTHLGSALQKTKRHAEALQAFQKAVAIAPDAARLCNLGAVLAEFGRGEEAVEALERSRALNPDNPETALNLGVAYRFARQPDVALRWLERAQMLLPKSSTPHLHKANIYLDNAQLQQALECCRQAVAMDSTNPASVSTLGRILQQMGHWEESLELQSLATILEPENQCIHSAHLYAATLSPLLSEADVVQRHAKWGQKLESTTSMLPARRISGDSNRILRIGYVSPDLRNHATMRFFMPLLESHDRTAVEVYCYSEVGKEDDTTARVKKLSAGWFGTCGLSDEIVARRIQEDQIDILVDLAGHTGGNRLPVFAMKPAPVQVSFLGYPGTTGLSRIDYFLTDAIRTPPSAVSAFTEKPVMMPGGACCYSPDGEVQISPPPFFNQGQITLGSTHRVEKISPQTWQTWAKVMAALPEAKLLIFRDVFKTESLRDHTTQVAVEAGIDANRLCFGWKLPEVFLDVYKEIDILLDVFPWGSGTTAYDCMWMGVPIPSIVGDRAGCRATASLLHNCGFPELVAADVEQYVGVIVKLANDPERLISLRNDIRPAMLDTVCNGPKFAREIEAAYRAMWEQHTVARGADGSVTS